MPGLLLEDGVADADGLHVLLLLVQACDNIQQYGVLQVALYLLLLFLRPVGQVDAQQALQVQLYSLVKQTLLVLLLGLEALQAHPLELVLGWECGEGLQYSGIFGLEADL